MAQEPENDRAKFLPVTPCDLPEKYAGLFEDEEIAGCFRGIRDLIVFTDNRLVAIDVKGITGKQKVITTTPYSHICEMTVETSGIIDLDTDMLLRTTSGTTLAYSFQRGKDVTKIQNLIGRNMKK